MKCYKLTMTSAEYGAEEFTYSSRAAAEAGQRRIQAKAAMLNDGIKRTYSIKKVEI